MALLKDLRKEALFDLFEKDPEVIDDWLTAWKLYSRFPDAHTAEKEIDTIIETRMLRLQEQAMDKNRERYDR